MPRKDLRHRSDLSRKASSGARAEIRPFSDIHATIDLSRPAQFGHSSSFRRQLRQSPQIATMPICVPSCQRRLRHAEIALAPCLQCSYQTAPLRTIPRCGLRSERKASIDAPPIHMAPTRLQHTPVRLGSCGADVSAPPRADTTRFEPSPGAEGRAATRGRASPPARPIADAPLDTPKEWPDRRA